MSANEAFAGRYAMSPMEAVVFGPDSIEQVANEVERIGMDRIMLLVSPSLESETGVSGRLRQILGDRVVEVFTGSVPHVPDTVVLEAAGRARDAGVDGLVSVGGGSPIDTAKAVSLCLSQDVRTREQLLEYAVKFTYPDQVVVPTIPGAGVPHIAVSTTLSAGEFTNIAGITDSIDLVKNLFIGDSLAARVAIHDPRLAAHTPRSLWASTGMRSVDHAIEGLCSTAAQPMTDTLAVEALRRLVRFLPASVSDPTDLRAASECQIGAWQSIFGLANVPLGLSHGVGHQLGARNGVPHGVTSCVMLPTVLDYNLEFTRERQQLINEIFASEMGIPTPSGSAGPIVKEFIRRLGLPTSLREVGVAKEDFPALAHDAIRDLIVVSNPRPITGEDDVIAVLTAAY